MPSSPCSSTSACRRVITVPAGPSTVSRSRPTRFWPKSSDRPAGRGGDHLPDRQLLDPADDRRGPRARGGDRVGGGRRGPAGVVESRAVPARLREPRVVVLAVVDPAGGDRPGGDPPGLVGGHHLPAAVRVRDHQLAGHGAAGRCRRVRPGRGSRTARWPSRRRNGARGRCVPGTSRPVTSVVSWIEPPLVRRPARLQHLVVDVAAVDAGLVDARERSRRASPETTSPAISNSVRARPGCASSRRFGQADRGGDPLPLGQETGDDAPRLAPVGGDAVVPRDPDPEPDVVPRAPAR